MLPSSGNAEEATILSFAFLEILSFGDNLKAKWHTRTAVGRKKGRKAPFIQINLPQK